MVPLTRALSEHRYGITDLTAIVYHGIVAAGDADAVRDTIGQLIAEQGLVDEVLLEAA